MSTHHLHSFHPIPSPLSLASEFVFLILLLLHTPPLDCSHHNSQSAPSKPCSGCPFQLEETAEPLLWHMGLTVIWSPFFSFLFFGFLGPHPWHMEVHSLGVESELQLPIYTTATATRDPSPSEAYTTAHSNAGSLTHWARPGIDPMSSWILVGFITSEPRWEFSLVPADTPLTSLILSFPGTQASLVLSKHMGHAATLGSGPWLLLLLDQASPKYLLPNSFTSLDSCK